MTDRSDHEATLAHIAELSRNARATWFGLIGLCLFVGITLLGHEDADFFAHGAETQLPLVNVTIPVRSFFVFAPLLVAALYIYLHLYLMNLWDALADAPPRIGGQPLADRVYPWLISHAALWERNRRRGDRSTAPRPMGRFVVVVSLLLGSFFGLFILGGLWARSMPAHEEWITLWIGACFCAATLVGITGFVTARRRMAGRSRAEVSRDHGVRLHWSIGFAFALFFLSWEATKGGLQTSGDDGQPTWLYRADLKEADLTRKPGGTVVYEHWVKDYAAKYREREDGNGKVTRQGDTGEENTDLIGNRDFIKEAVARFNAPFDAPDLRDADLRQANMFRAFLPGADLRGASMEGINLIGAELQGVQLGCDVEDRPTMCEPANLRAGNLTIAKLQGADLRGVEMRDVKLPNAIIQGADFSGANMNGALLIGAEMRGARLSGVYLNGAALAGAQMQGIDLSGARMSGSLFHGAQMRGANLSRVDLRQAELISASLRGADLSGADLQEVRLVNARMQGANLNYANMRAAEIVETEMDGVSLIEAQMQGANLIGVGMRGANLIGVVLQGRNCPVYLQAALLFSATVICRGLSQSDFEQTVGNLETVLPRGIHVFSCLETLPVSIRDVLALHPEKGDGARWSRAEIESALFCDPGETPHFTGTDVFERYIQTRR